MKQFTTTLLFSVICVFSFAQTPFTEQTLLDMNKRLMQDFPKFMAEEVSPDYTFTTEDGALISYQAMKDFKIKILEWNTHDLKIKQIGNASIVRGINKNTIQSATSGAIRKYNLQFIYTYEYKNGKWLWFSSHHIYNNPSKADEEVAIKKALNEQVVAFHNADKDIMAKFYINDPKTFHLASGTAGEFWLRDYETTKKALAEMKPTGITPTRSNYQIKIVGNMAVAHYDQENKGSNGKIRTEHNMNVLEKVDNNWKIIGTSVHPNNLANEDNPIEVYKQWVQEYNKDSKSFLLDKCPDDLVGTVNGGAFYNNEGFKNMKEGQQAHLEPSDMKSFQSGNLAVVMGIFTSLKKEADGTQKPSKEVFTAVMQKRNGKWLYVGHHATDMKQ